MAVPCKRAAARLIRRCCPPLKVFTNRVTFGNCNIRIRKSIFSSTSSVLMPAIHPKYNRVSRNVNSPYNANSCRKSIAKAMTNCPQITFCQRKKSATIPVAYIRCVVQEHPIRETRAYRPAPIFRPNSSVADRRCTITMSFCRSPMPPTVHIYQITRKQLGVIIISRIRALSRPTLTIRADNSRPYSHRSFWHRHVQAVQDDVRVGFGAVALVRATHADGLLSPGGHRRWL